MKTLILSLFFLVSCNEVVHKNELEIEQEAIQKIIPGLCSYKQLRSNCWNKFSTTEQTVQTSEKYRDQLHSLFSNKGYTVSKNEQGLVFNFSKEHKMYKNFQTYIFSLEQYLFFAFVVGMVCFYFFATRGYREMVKQTKKLYKKEGLLFWNKTEGDEVLMENLSKNRLPIGWQVHFDEDGIAGITKITNSGIERIASTKESLVNSFRRNRQSE